MKCYLGVDVGTGSVRCGAFDIEGTLLSEPIVKSIKIFNPKDNFFQQSSVDIWETVCNVVRQTVVNMNLEVLGIGFDATCSLVNLDENDVGISIDSDEGLRG